MTIILTFSFWLFFGLAPLIYLPKVITNGSIIIDYFLFILPIFFLVFYRFLKIKEKKQVLYSVSFGFFLPFILLLLYIFWDIKKGFVLSF
jgi:hypothetical protein